MNFSLIIYIANIIIISWISISAIFFPRSAIRTVFSNSYEYSETVQLVGCMWASILIISLIGLWYPSEMAIIFVFQALYKSLWLVFVALPAYWNRKPFPKPMAIFFLIWALVTPFAYISTLVTR